MVGGRLYLPLLVLGVGLALPLGAGHADPRQPGAAVQRPDPRIQTGGNAQIRGQIVAVDTGQPLYRALVVLRTSAPGRLTALTDLSGRYEFSGLPAGRYTISAEKAGFLPKRFGARRFADAGTPIDVAGKQSLENIDIALMRGGVIAGFVTDELGQPVIDATVQASRTDYGQGRPRLVTTGRPARTDDLGQFRLFGLPPGGYYISAVARRLDDVGADSERVGGYAPTYYPGTADLVGAQRVALTAGEQVLSISFPLAPARLANIAGVVLDSQGNPFTGAALTLIRRDARGPIASPLSASARGDGSFAIRSVAPGGYVVQVRGRSAGVPEFAAVRLVVIGEDLDGLTLVTSSGAVIDGKVVFDGTPPRVVPSTVQVTAHPADLPAGRLVEGSASARLNRDWTFRLTGLFGPRLFRLAGLPSPWSIDRVLLNGADVTDRGVELDGTQRGATLEVVVTNRVTEVTGTVHDARGQPADGALIVVFASDSTSWGPLSRFVTGVRVGTGGQFTVSALPPANYLALALPDLEPGRWFDAEFLEWARPHGEAFSLAPGERKVLALRLQQDR